jgi:hypothetical protein
MRTWNSRALCQQHENKYAPAIYTLRHIRLVIIVPAKALEVAIIAVGARVVTCQCKFNMYWVTAS